MGEPAPRLKQVLHAGLLARDGAAQPVAPSPLPVGDGFITVDRGGDPVPTTAVGRMVECFKMTWAVVCFPCLCCWDSVFDEEER